MMVNPLDQHNKDRKLAELIVETVKRNFADEEFDVEKLRITLNISDSKLCSIFKEEFEETAKIYLLNRRLDEAMVLLQDYKLNIAQISYKVGIKNPSYFSSSFKKRFGKTPSEVMMNSHHRIHRETPPPLPQKAPIRQRQSII